jgi:hypothetical protein
LTRVNSCNKDMARQKHGGHTTSRRPSRRGQYHTRQVLFVGISCCPPVTANMTKLSEGMKLSRLTVALMRLFFARRCLFVPISVRKVVAPSRRRWSTAGDLLMVLDDNGKWRVADRLGGTTGAPGCGHIVCCAILIGADMRRGKRAKAKRWVVLSAGVARLG